VAVDIDGAPLCSSGIEYFQRTKRQKSCLPLIRGDMMRLLDEIKLQELHSICQYESITTSISTRSLLGIGVSRLELSMIETVRQA